ncbi:helix-turn-helix domain-containing protein [Methylobacterium sp. BTF04]|uniref:helix-turn-helix domain-containing protein n=1 Tax=Methylobacterium sp. BTF04 TaxID=2708300 RepID=UPI0013D32969|nr:helix-turn-helix domain-containing protein [Methylobacterium sp. BTF04]NEU12736.1 helix-turn-helix domain-containing protein [Methylobacterium sp. BTF04]
MKAYNFGQILVWEVYAPAHRLERPARMVARQGIDHVLLLFYESDGGKGETGWRPGEARTRKVAIIDMAQPVLIDVSIRSAIAVVLPRALISDSIGVVEALHGQILDSGEDPAPDLLHTYLRGLIACAGQLGSHQLPALAAATSKMCGACFPAAAALRRPIDLQTNVAVRQFIRRELGSFHLTVEAIVAEFGLSRATLYRLFEAEGGVAGYIRERRLLWARRLLTQADGHGRMRVSAVAYTTGFSDEKSFSRAFKRRFGCLPRDTAVPEVFPWTGSDDAAILLSWMRDLAA